jgi:hypothetical protein
MKHEVTLGVWDRTTLLSLIGGLSGGKMSEIVIAARILKTLALNEEEREAAGFKPTESGATWERDVATSLSFSDEDWKWLKTKVNEFENWPFGSAIQIAELASKLE